MGFVGFKTTEAATAALKYFDRTFIDATRIGVEVSVVGHAMAPVHVTASAAAGSLLRCPPALLTNPLQYARKYKDPTLARPWSKHSEGSSAHDKRHSAREVDGNASEAAALAARLTARRSSGKSLNGKKDAGGGGGGLRALAGLLPEGVSEQDPKLQEFLALMAPRNRAKLWANDELAPTQTLEDLLVRFANNSGDC